VPGLSVHYARATGGEISPGRWQAALAETDCLPASTVETLFEDRICRIGARIYPGYPLETREDERGFACLEGRPYGQRAADVLEGALACAADPAADARWRDLCRRAADWDGEFILLVYGKGTGRLRLTRDALGHLPLYLRPSADLVSLSRDQSFLLSVARERAVDPLGLAQFLLFGYPVGARTLVAGVQALLAGEALEVGAEGTEIRPVPEAQVDLEAEPISSTGVGEEADELVALFLEGCRARAGLAPTDVVALSGGLDSRAVASALARLGLPFRAITYLDPAGVFRTEPPAAQRVAEALGAPWQLYTPPPPRGADLGRLLGWKLGLNPMSQAHGVDLMRAVLADHGPQLTLWTGDGRDKIMTDPRPPLRGTRASTVAYLVAKQRVWTPEQVAELVGVPAEDLVDSLRAVVESYPEKSPAFRAARFVIAERGRRWMYEGEDRNRHAFWTASPFYTRAFVRRALRCPFAHKAGYRLYRSFLLHLHRVTSHLVDGNVGFPVSAWYYVPYRLVREGSRRFPRLQRLLRGSAAPGAGAPQTEFALAVMEQQRARSAGVRQAFARGAFDRRLASRLSDASPFAVDTLFSAACAVEQIVDGRSTLAEFADRRFG
jgi:asparagine synthase (glutamine-hydrolysing)